MNTNPTPNNNGTGFTPDQYSRSATVITLVLTVIAILTAAIFAFLGYSGNLPQLYIPAAILAVASIFDLFSLSLIRKGRINLAMMIVGTVFLVKALTIPFFTEGLGLIIAASIMVVITSITGLAMKSNRSIPGVVGALILGAAAFFMDTALGGDRVKTTLPDTYSLLALLVIVASAFIVLLREFKRFTLQAKITLGILVTGGITVAALSYFGLGRANVIIGSLSNRYEESVKAQTEQEILGAVQSKAGEIDALLTETTNDLVGIAEYLSNLGVRRDAFFENTYWNSAEKVFQLPDGQYGNSGTDPASIYLPNTYTLDNEIIRDLNANIFLDFVTPGFLESHPDVVAIYYISSLGYTIYYPNIDLAENIPPDFNPLTQPFYTIGTPERNPDRLPQWTKPYQDPAGSGLIVTLTVPVYSKGGNFKGVISVDIQLARISELVSGIHLGETDFAFLVDKNSFIITMPEEGYQLYGLEPKEIPVNESPTQSLFDTDSPILHFAAQRLLINNATLLNIRIDGVETYFAIAGLESTGYKLILIAPESELNAQIVSSRREVQDEIDTTLQGAILILIMMFIGALLVSIWVGQIITQPLKRLTTTVDQITRGNLSARVEIKTQDETGMLARAFNSMAERLHETLSGLEDRIMERTSELEKISESNAYRASQFEAIARISHTISSTQALDNLLPQITETISEELGFYHVGIFLLDTHKEYAVLVAANSEGGKAMLARSHRLRVGEIGIVGYATRSGEPRIALDVGLDAVYFNNPDLPETHSEIALPLRIGLEVIGALDVQSTKTNAFSQEDVSILSTLTDQVSIAIQNARSYQQSVDALRQAQQIAAQLGEQQWSQFLSQQTIAGYHFDGVEARSIQPTDGTDAQSLSIPLVLRGTRIGTLKLHATDPSRTWDEDERAMAQATAERTAFAIENARLIQDAQKRAAKEHAIGQISSKISNLVSLESILQTTVQELGNTLPGTDVAIQFTEEFSDRKKRAGE
jgi:GAF domain-containing protein/HAMP domain-containing protein